MASALRALRAPSFRSLLRASRSGLVLPKYAPRTAVRWESAAAAIQAQLEPDVVAAEFDLPLDPSKKPQATSDHAAIESDQPEFSTLKSRISHDTLKAITVSPMKHTHMSSVQAAVLPLLPELAEPYDPEKASEADPKSPRDLLVKAKTGTGKTLAFLVPAIEARLKAIDAYGKEAVKKAGLVSDKHLEGRAQRIFTRGHVGALIISPTRELAQQIANAALGLVTHHKGFGVHLFVGGTAKRRQLRDFMTGRRDIVVATPGRLRDLLENEPDVLEGVSKAKMFILDEADTLLDMGFREDIEAIARELPPAPERQTFLFSATVSRAIQQVARATLDKNHVYINCVSDSAPPVHAHIPQFHSVLPGAGHQIPHILRLLAHDQLTNPGKSKTIVFCPTTKMTQLYSTFLRSLAKKCLPAGTNTTVYEIHSLRGQESRTRTSDMFRRDRSGSSILVSSDVSARGVDYPGVTRIIQIGVPASSDQYVHRVGRTGRGIEVAGRADLVLLPWEVGFVTWQLTDIPMKPLTVSELTTQVDALSKDFDEHPAAYAPTPRGLNDRHIHPFTPALETMDTAISEFVATLDENAISETLGSLLGFYIARSHELRVQRPVIVQGLKDWTVEACGLPKPPYISDAFLHKLGINDGRTGNNYRGKVERRPQMDNGPRGHWMGRGSQRLKDAKRSTDMESTYGYKSMERKPRYREDGDSFGGDRDSDSAGRYGGGDRGDRYGGDKADRYGGDKGDRYGGKRNLNSRFEDRGDRFERRGGFGVKRDEEEGGYSRPSHHEAKHRSFR